ncbi:hypothetical protein EDB89DRAFT_826331 [Lactarius sanguifluus]|nr:hypothetical protein EDB89DRAFT_826331 [Lactarius sanguifluus]
MAVVGGVRTLRGSKDGQCRSRTTSSHQSKRGPCGSTPITQLVGMPYSEHSLSFELACFVQSLDLARIVPGERGERHKPREDLYLHRTLGGRAGSARLVSFPISHSGVLVIGTISLIGRVLRRIRRVIILPLAVAASDP